MSLVKVMLPIGCRSGSKWSRNIVSLMKDRIGVGWQDADRLSAHVWARCTVVTSNPDNLVIKRFQKTKDTTIILRHRRWLIKEWKSDKVTV